MFFSEENEDERTQDMYTECFCYDKKTCGPYKRYRLPVDKMFPVNKLDIDVKSHFVNLKVLKDHCETDWDEKRLIENRLNQVLVETRQLCAYHRYTLGVGWKPSKCCQHPDHVYQFGKKSTPGRPAPIPVALSMTERYGVSVPVGSILCHKHLKAETKLTNMVGNAEEKPSAVNDLIVAVGALTPDAEYKPEEVLVSEDTLDMSARSGQELATVLEASPIKFQLKRRLEHIDHSTKQQLVWKFKRMEEHLKLKFAESVAPGQAEEFCDKVLNKTANIADNKEEIPPTIIRYLNMYNQSDSMGKLVILSLLDHSKYSKQLIMKVFKCTKYRVDLARKWHSSSKGLMLPQKRIFNRDRLDLHKSEHFLDFIFSNGLLQDVAYGITKIKYDSGDDQVIAHAILTSKFSHTIAFYRQSCSETGYTPLSESSMWKILHAIKPSQRKSLAGLDDTTAGGMNGFATLQKVALLYNCKALEASLERSKRYLKTRFQVHCSDVKTTIASHCAAFALSDPAEKLLQSTVEVSSNVCAECFELCKALEEVEELAVENGADADAMYDIDVSVKAIFTYMKHLMRDAQQKKAKIYAFGQLDCRTGFWLKDFCQKIIPMRFREGQREYFGKKGMSLHVDIFFLKKKEKLVKHVYFTAMYRSEQGTGDVLCLADKVLDQFKADEPSVSRLFAKSDNAGCYHSNYSAESVYNICKNKDIQLLRYDFNEPSCGKDQCDRESAGAKTIIRSYVDAGNDLLSAEQLHEALHYGFGMKDSKVAVAQIDNSKILLDGPKIPKISNYHSIEFHGSYMKMWRYFNIGQGLIQTYRSLLIHPAIDVTCPYSATNSKIARVQSGMLKKKRQDRQLCNLLFCQEASCTESFEEIADLELHMLSGQHSFAKETSSLDKVRRQFVGKMKSTSLLHVPGSSSSIQRVDFEAAAMNKYMNLFGHQGWALPVRCTFRFTEKQKGLLYKYFASGEESGKKMSPEQVHQLIRKDLTPKEYVTSQQIRSLFSRWSKMKHQGKLQILDNDEDDCAMTEGACDSDVVNEVANDAAEEYQLDLHDLAEELCQTWRKDDWVAVVYDKHWYPGVIVEVTGTKIRVSCMKYVSPDKNCFRWPDFEDIFCYQDDEVLCDIKPPVPVNRRGNYSLADCDFTKANMLLANL